MQTQHYEVWTYDIHTEEVEDEEGDIRYEYHIRDRMWQHEVTLAVEAVYEPTSEQLDQVVGAQMPLVWRIDDDGVVYADTAGGRPVCELVRLTTDEDGD